ncbi:hypothetical protein FN846DRAFT_647453 [Sphaerosporella brunnea]|uniref:Uncharacterized protein n=1 Tax=Sphaerosporella brunnea TaxID=1250544 RepID=A0A5J5F051_9PEZI|nr:hypothetical protein FN846DRAFT_647453 [Sphaerosporella brunnea]
MMQGEARQLLGAGKTCTRRSLIGIRWTLSRSLPLWRLPRAFLFFPQPQQAPHGPDSDLALSLLAGRDAIAYFYGIAGVACAGETNDWVVVCGTAYQIEKQQLIRDMHARPLCASRGGGREERKDSKSAFMLAFPPWVPCPSFAPPAGISSSATRQRARRCRQ